MSDGVERGGLSLCRVISVFISGESVIGGVS